MNKKFTEKIKYNTKTLEPEPCIINNEFNIHLLDKNKYIRKNKNNTVLKDNLDPFDYDIQYKNTENDDDNEQIYFKPYNQGPGRGFGNLNISNQIRNSNPSRQNNDEFKLYRESEIINRFEFIDNRYANPSNLVFPYPRTGIFSRKVGDMHINLNNDLHNYDTNQDNIESYDINSLSMSVINKNDNDQLLINNLPNKNVINKINETNNNLLEKQKKYNYKLEIIQNIINKLKIEYGNKLTKEIIQNEVNKIIL
jgi:hypothetical protein